MMLFNFKYIVLIFVFLIFSKISFNQTFSAGIGIGYGIYKQDKLKQLQSNLKNSTGITNLSSVETFPSYIFYAAQLNYNPGNKMNSFGLEFNNYMTGARNHVADYSGEYILDMYLNGYRFGMNYKMNVEKIGPVYCFGQVGAGILFNKMELLEKLTINNEEIFSESIALSGVGIYFEPKIIFSFPVSDKLSLDLNASYEYDFKNKLHVKNNRDQIIYIGYQNPASVNWTGFRFILSLSYVFFLKAKI